METLALIGVGLLGIVVVAPVALLLKWLKLLPAGVGALLAGGMFWAILVGGLFASNYIGELIVRPWHLQAAHLGGQYGTPLNMRRYSASGFQDLVFETSYQLSPAQAARLRARCGKDTQAFGLSGCELYSWQGGDESTLILLSSDNQLHIVELA